MEKYRSQEVAERYKSIDSQLTIIGDQSSYEWQQDLITMKWTLFRLSEFLDYYENKYDKPTHFNSLQIGYKELLNRISKYSCPNMRKDKKNCPLKEKCFCQNLIK